MTTHIRILVSIISATCAVITVARSNKRADTRQGEQKATESAILNAKLDQIGSDMSNIKYDITLVKKDVVGLTERIFIVEQSTKSAHHRMDKLVNKESEDKV